MFFAYYERACIAQLIMRVSIDSSPYNGEPGGKLLHPTGNNEDIVKLVKSLGLKDNREVINKERANFSFEQLLPLLEWLKINMQFNKEYVSCGPSDLDETLQYRQGACTAFSELLDAMVYVAGGFSKKIERIATLNLPLYGRDYFSVPSTSKIRHALNRVYYDGRWHIVDPTIYNTTYNNPEIPVGLERRAYSPMVKKFVNYLKFAKF